MPRFLRWPDRGSAAAAAVKASFEARSGVPDVVGAMYTTHIPIIAPKVHVASYFNRRHRSATRRRPTPSRCRGGRPDGALHRRLHRLAGLAVRRPGARQVGAAAARRRDDGRLLGRRRRKLPAHRLVPRAHPPEPHLDAHAFNEKALRCRGSLADADADPGPDDACGALLRRQRLQQRRLRRLRGPLLPSGADAGPPSLLSDDLPRPPPRPPRSLQERLRPRLPPLWGLQSVCGRRPEMEDAAAVVPRFHRVPLWMVAGDGAVDDLDRTSFRLPAHFFAVYDGHGGAEVADYCRDKLHTALVQELRAAEGRVGGCDDLSSLDSKKQWEKAFVDCFCRVDAEVEAPDTAGSTAVAAVVCSSHIIVSNCGDSRAVLCRGKAPLPLSLDHKPNREDEYARIEALGGKVIQWNGYRVLGVLAMSRSIGDRYLKLHIIPVPEVTVVAQGERMSASSSQAMASGTSCPMRRWTPLASESYSGIRRTLLPPPPPPEEATVPRRILLPRRPPSTSPSLPPQGEQGQHHRPRGRPQGT
ncbi:hypothetical protein ZWY2020_045713 [Hordeum vulgare]|nr:hypothetical protein ZWY2020_045713 [Hordeum vulgare]